MSVDVCLQLVWDTYVPLPSGVECLALLNLLVHVEDVVALWEFLRHAFLRLTRVLGYSRWGEVAGGYVSVMPGQLFYSRRPVEEW
jgi:hypothetical protein